MPLADDDPLAPTAVATAAAFRAWLEDHHTTAPRCGTALWGGFLVWRTEHDA